MFVISAMHSDRPHILTNVLCLSSVEDTDMNQAPFKIISKIRRQAVFLLKATRVSASCSRLNSSCMPQILTPFKALLEAIPNTDYAKDFVQSRTTFISAFDRSCRVASQSISGRM